jgi:hypothetical protein
VEPEVAEAAVSEEAVAVALETEVAEVAVVVVVEAVQEVVAVVAEVAVVPEEAVSVPAPKFWCNLMKDSKEFMFFAVKTMPSLPRTSPQANLSTTKRESALR